MGGMIALMPTPDDAARLALDGGEAAEELHLTLYFLGDDGDSWTDERRTELAEGVRAAVAELEGPFTATAFGVNHWNPHTDSPSWVWAVGDSRDRPDGMPTLEQVRRLVTSVLDNTQDRPELPVQHSPRGYRTCAPSTAQPRTGCPNWSTVSATSPSTASASPSEATTSTFPSAPRRRKNPCLTKISRPPRR
ncbi:hypothetical protein ACGH7X_00075 [Streptomyces sp. BBFR51]|uniref:hypothetical protein n=1 Tax=Streptomyces sp. BBFR51 TaxID=3372856 RepID=UPI0037DD4E0F